MGGIQRRLVVGVMKVVTFPKTTLLVALVVLGASVYLAMTRLSISTDQNKLVSADLPFFRNYLNFIQKFPENEAIYVVITARDPNHEPAPEKWMALADGLAEVLKQSPDVKAVDAKVPLEALGRQSLLFADWADVKAAGGGAKDLRQLASVFGEKAGLLQAAALGPTPIERFLRGLALKPVTEEDAAFTRLLAESWNKALDNPVEKWQALPGREIPDLGALEGQRDPSRFGYQYLTDSTDATGKRHLLAISVYEQRDFSSLAQVSGPLERMRKLAADKVAAMGAGADFQVVFTGRPALEADEMNVSQADTEWAEIGAGITVFIGMVIAFTKWQDVFGKKSFASLASGIWMALVAELSLGIAVGWTFGYVTVAVGELNLLSTVFVIAMIGIGMDYLVQILTRYRQEMQRYERHHAVWARVFRYVSPPISTACMGAAGAFFVSTLTRFKGAAELGVVAGGGLLLCLLSGYTVLPALLTLWPARLDTAINQRKFAPVVEEKELPVVQKKKNWLLVGPVLWICAVVLLIPMGLKIAFNSNLLSLQPQGLPSVQMIAKLPTWYGVVLTKNLDEMAGINTAVKSAAVNSASPIAHTDSILDAEEKQRWLVQNTAVLDEIKWAGPADADGSKLGLYAQSALNLADHFIAAKSSGAEVAAATLRTFAQKLNAAAKEGEREQIAARLSAWQDGFSAELKNLTGTLRPGPLKMDKSPDTIRAHYQSTDGTYALYIYPRENDLSEGRKLEEFVEAMEAVVPGNAGQKTSGGNSAGVTGIAVQFYHSTQEIQRAFGLATLYALGLIFVLVLIDLRNLGQTFLAVSVLGLGLPLLIEIMGWIGISWNFANFFGLPILIGAGHEYGVFMVHRYKETLHNPRRRWGRWDVSDAALALCGFITCSAFGYLAFARHRGLASLGEVMALGCGCIYLATVVVVRPILKWRLARKNIG